MRSIDDEAALKSKVDEALGVYQDYMKTQDSPEKAGGEEKAEDKA